MAIEREAIEMHQAINMVESAGRASSILANRELAPEIRVALVDSDGRFRDRLSNKLSAQGFEVTAFSDDQSILAAPNALSAVDFIVLDWGDSTSSGLDLLHQLRRRGVDLPVVFLARRALISHENLAFEHGAVDYIDKARGISILVHRLRIVARIKVPTPRQDEVLRVDNLKLRPRGSRAFWNDVDLDLTVGEFRIVSLLATNVGRRVTYREIYDVLHYRGFVAGAGENGYRANVRSAIKRIRRKFEERDPTFDRIQNHTAFGYIWVKD